MVLRSRRCLATEVLFVHFSRELMRTMFLSSDFGPVDYGSKEYCGHVEGIVGVTPVLSGLPLPLREGGGKLFYEGGRIRLRFGLGGRSFTL